MATVTSPTTPSTPPVIQRAKRQYGRPKLAARPDILSGPTNSVKDSMMESSSVVEDSEPERVRYRECFASTDLSDPPMSANKNHRFGNWREELERIDADFDDREDVTASPVKLKTSKTSPRASRSQTDHSRTPFGMRSVSKGDSETSTSKGRNGVLSSAKSGSSCHPSSSPPPTVSHHRDKGGEENTTPPGRAQTTKGIARIFEETEEDSPLQRPRTQRHVSDGMRPLHETETSPATQSTQGTKRGGKRLLRRCADGSMTSKKRSKPKAHEAPRSLGDGEDGDDELLLEGDRKGKLKETIPDEKEIEAFLADASGEEESTKKGKKRKSKSEKSKEPKEKPLTKKQLIEMEKETAKMKAERPVDAQASAIWHPRTIIGFLRRTLSKGQKELTTIPPPPRHITPPPKRQSSSDPIVDTSGPSSPDVSSQRFLARPAPAAQAPEFVPAPPTAEPRTPPAQKNKVFVPHPSDYEDDDEPSNLEEIRRHTKQQKEAENKAKAMRQAAYEKKMAALRAKSNIPVVDDDDELEIEESPKKPSLKRKRDDTSDEEAAVKPKPTAMSKGRAIQAQFGAVKTKPIVVGRRRDTAHAGLSHKELNQMLLKRATEQKVAVIKAKEADYEARGGRLKRRQKIVADSLSYAELIEALERAPLPDENHAGQDPDQDDGDYHPGTESPCKGRAFMAESGFVEDEIKVKIEEEEEGLPLATFLEGGLGSPLPVNNQLLEYENPFPLHLRPTQPRRLHGTDSEDDNPFPLHLRPKQPRRLHGTDSENEDANPFPPHLRPKHPRRVMSSDEEGGNSPTQRKSSVPTGKARDSIKPLGESQSHSNFGACSTATNSTESLNSVHLPEPDPRERLFSSIPAVLPPPLARTISGSFEMYSDSGGDMVRHHSANASFNLPTFEPLACLPTLPSPGLSSPSINMTPAIPLSTPTQASTSKVSPGGSLLPAKDNYQLTAKGVYYFNLESGHQEFLDRPRTPPPKGDAVQFGGITSQLFFSQAESSSETGTPTKALRHGESPVNLKTQVQPPNQPPVKGEDTDEEPVIRPIKRVASLAFTKIKSPEPASKPVDPLAHLRVPIATEGFGFTQEVEGAGLLPELKLNTQEAAEFRRVEAQDLDDLLREKVEMRKAQIIEALAAGQPADPSWLNDYGMFTQTKPRVTSPLTPGTIMAWPFTPSPTESPIKLKPSSSDAENSPRKPGRGLKRKADLEADKEADESASPRKIARTESTENITGPSDAFTVIMANRQFADAKKDKRRQRKISEKGELKAFEKEFVADEADESDDELDFGFGKTQKTDDEEAQGDELTTEDKAMVDDRVLGAHELKEDAVIEKHKEHLEEDDAALQKIHEAAVAGKLRGGKKRGRDVAMSDSESEDEEYRRPKSKKRKVIGDKLEDLAHDDETKAFYAAYQNDLEDQDDDLKHLNIVHDHFPGIEDAADGLGDEEADIEGEQEASWKRDVGVSDSHVEEEEEHHSPETGAGNDFDLDRFVGDAYPSSPGALSPQKFAETDLRRRPTTKLENADDLHYPLPRPRCTVNAQWAKENSKTYETSARCGAATVVTRRQHRRVRDPRQMPSDVKQASKGPSRNGTLGPTLKKSWDEAKSTRALMQNLSILSKNRWFLDGNGLPTAIAFDLDEGAAYVGYEESREDSARISKAAGVHIQKIEPGADPITIGTYTSNNAVSSSYPTGGPFILSLHFVPETRQLVFILANGDIVRYPVDDQDASFDVVGSFDRGLEAAAWSPDDALLILATADGKLVEMSSDFDVLRETDLRPSEFGEDAQVNINWGSKSTQFHGSLGKTAAAAANHLAAPPGSSPDDDGRVRISWRGDAALFALSTLDPYDTSIPSMPKCQRTIRVYNRDAVLQSTVETTPGLEHPLAWRPSGNFIATTQRFFGPEFGHGGGVGREGRHDIVFFERNGLRRLEVGGQWVESPKAPTKDTEGRVTWGYKVVEMSWSCDSNILAILLRDPDGDTLQFWVTGNWHWYLKLELRTRSTSETPGRYTAARWHPEDGNRLLVCTHNSIQEYNLGYETSTSFARPPHDLGTVAVINGCSLHLTPFRIQNIPPPMAAYTLKIPHSQRPPSHVALSSSGDGLALLWSSPIPVVEIWDLKTRRVGGRGKVMAPVLVWKESWPNQSEAWQVALSESNEGTWVTAILCAPHSATSEACLVIATLKGGKCVDRHAIPCSPNGRLVPGDEQQLGLALESSEGLLYRVGHGEDTMLPISSFPEFCPVSQQVAIKLGLTVVTLLLGLSAGSKLYATTPSHAIAPLLSSAVSSFAVAGPFLIYTTSAHESIYVPLSALAELLETPGLDMREGGAEGALSRLTKAAEKRRIERGSRIIVAIPSAMSLVLQMPRGNLETINPRPLVLEVVKSDIDCLEYRKAFLACRKHRIDLNFLVELNSDLFSENVGRFVDQIPEVDHLNLFLSGIGQSKSQDPDRIAFLCDSLRLELEKRGLVKYMNCILTSYVVKTPPDYEAALSLMHRLRQSDSQAVEDAVGYIMFLVDPDKLFDIALGMYDFSLVLLIAQNSQKVESNLACFFTQLSADKDPREYLPFLRELWSLEESYRHYRINDHLKRYPSALKSLREGGNKYFEEATKYVEKHRLYKNALQLWKDSPQEYTAFMELYGDWLFDRREFKDASLAFTKANKPSKAMLAHEKAHDWQSLFALVEAQDFDCNNRRQLGLRIAEDLTSRKRWSEAAQVYLDYTGSIDEAVTSLVSGNELSGAIRIARRNNRTDLIDSVITPGALDIRTQIGDDLEEMKEQLRKQSARLRELEERRKNDPDTFFGREEPTLDNVDVMTDVSTPMTTFTRYTTAPTSTSKATTSKRTSRSKRKLDMKQAAGRKGTVDEEQYILRSLGKLAARLIALQEEAGKLLPHLAVLSDEHVMEGEQLQEDISVFEKEFKAIVEDSWKEEHGNQGAIAAETVEQPQEAKLKPEKPVFGGGDWKIKLLL